MEVLLQKRLGTGKDILASAIKYLEKTRDFIASVNIDELRAIEKAIADLSAWGNHAQITGLESYVKIFDEFMRIDNDVKVLVALFKNPSYMKYVISNMSTTFVVNIYKERNRILNLYESYIDNSIAIEEEIIANAFENLNIDEAFKFIISNTNVVNKFMIRLIGVVISAVSGDRRRRLELLIERQKDYVLGSSRAHLYEGLVRYGLKPVSHFMNVHEIAQEIKHDDVNTIDQLTDVIVISRGTKSPIEFNWDGLINTDYIEKHGLKTNPSMGLNNKILERFITTKRVGTTISPHFDSIRVYGESSANKYVLETFDGETYRFLAHNDRVGPVPTTEILGLVSGLTNRAQKYNNTHESAIVNICMDSKLPNILAEYAELAMQTISTDVIKSNISDKLTAQFDKDIEDYNVKDSHGYRRAAVNERVIADILWQALPHVTGEHGRGSQEYLVTYVAKMDSIVRSFTHELVHRVSLSKITDRIFTEHSGKELLSILRAEYVSAIHATIDQLGQTRVWSDYDNTLKEFVMDQKQVIV